MTYLFRLALLALPLSFCPKLALSAQEMPAAACPPPIAVNGFRTVTVEGGKMRLRVPASIALGYTQDCKQVRHFSLTYMWRDGRLTPPTRSPAYDQLVKVYPAFEPLDSARLKAASYRYLGVALPHRAYPLDLNERVDRSRNPSQPDSEKLESFMWSIWSVRGTSDPVTSRPFSADCQIQALDRARPETAVEGDFPRNNPDARCRGFINAVRGENVIRADVHIWATNAPYIDRIYRAVAAELHSYILED